MNMKRILIIIAISLITGLLFVGMNTPVFAQTGGFNFVDEDGDGFNDNAPDHDGDGIPNGIDPDYTRSGNMKNYQIWDQLTEEQQQEIQTMIESMQTENATQDEIHNAIVSALESWGIEVPENFATGQGLNYLQRIQIREMVQTLREQGASREEIRAAISEQLGEWGHKAGNGSSGSSSGNQQGNGRRRGARP